MPTSMSYNMPSQLPCTTTSIITNITYSMRLISVTASTPKQHQQSFYLHLVSLDLKQ